MIRPLRRRHQWMIPALFLLVLAASVLALLHPSPSARMDRLPAALVDAERPLGSR